MSEICYISSCTELPSRMKKAKFDINLPGVFVLNSETTLPTRSLKKLRFIQY